MIRLLGLKGLITSQIFPASALDLIIPLTFTCLHDCFPFACLPLLKIQHSANSCRLTLHGFTSKLLSHTLISTISAADKENCTDSGVEIFAKIVV